jgi:hypothetical protein
VVTLYGDVFAALHEAGVRNVVVGGVAVVMQGHVRTTVDLGLVIDLAVEPATAAMDALGRLGLLPRIPVEPRAFADESKRLDWGPGPRGLGSGPDRDEVRSRASSGRGRHRCLAAAPVMTEWLAGTFEGAAAATAAAAATSTVEQRMAWLEEALALAALSGALTRLQEERQAEVDRLWAGTA